MKRRRFDEAELTPIIGRYVVPRGEPPAAHLEGGSEVLHSADLSAPAVLLQAMAGDDGGRVPHAPPWQLSERQLHLATFELLIVASVDRDRRVATARAAATEARARAAVEATALARERSARGVEAGVGSPAVQRRSSFGPRPTVDVPRAATAESAYEFAMRAGAATLEGFTGLGRVASQTLSPASTSPGPRGPAAGLRAPATLAEGDEWRLAFGLTRREQRALAAGMRPPEELRAEQLFADGTLASVHYHLLLLSLRRPHHFATYAEFALWAERRLAHVACALCCALTEADAEELVVEVAPLWLVPSLLGREPVPTAAVRAALVRVALGAAQRCYGRGDLSRQGGVGRMMQLPARKSSRSRSGAASPRNGTADSSASSSGRLVCDLSGEGPPPPSWAEDAHVGAVQALNSAAWQIYAQLETRGASLGALAIEQRLPVTYPYSAFVWTEARADRGAARAREEEAAAEAGEAEAEAAAEAAADGGAAGTDAARTRELSLEAAARRLLRPLALSLKLSARRRTIASAALALQRWAARPLGEGWGDGGELDAAALARSEWVRALCAAAVVPLRKLLVDYHAHSAGLKRTFKQLVDAFAIAFLAGAQLTDAGGDASGGNASKGPIRKALRAAAAGGELLSARGHAKELAGMDAEKAMAEAAADKDVDFLHASSASVSDSASAVIAPGPAPISTPAPAAVGGESAEPNWASVLSGANMRVKLGELYGALLRAHDAANAGLKNGLRRPASQR
ncbi:hypothetical protein T492DRAFT_891041 [Pavlovales sp. CCMP2436]|nr:hypothetical protein T492DRAFT_891041 [Pavlovales sp. CCMP2436]